MERRKHQRRKGPNRVTGDRRKARIYLGQERRIADRRSGLDRRQLDMTVDYQVRSVPILRCSGRITIGPAATNFAAKCSELLQRGRPTIALDLSGITHLDSTGIGKLMAIFTSARNRGGDVKLIAPSQKVQTVLKATFIYELFKVFSSSQELAEQNITKRDKATGP